MDTGRAEGGLSLPELYALMEVVVFKDGALTDEHRGQLQQVLESAIAAHPDHAGHQRRRRDQQIAEQVRALREPGIPLSYALRQWRKSLPLRQRQDAPSDRSLRRILEATP